MSKQTGRLSQANNSNQGAKSNYNYSELDEFLHSVTYPDTLAKSFRQIHSTLTYALALLANNNIDIGVPEQEIGDIFDIDKFFAIIEGLKEDPGSSSNGDPDQAGSGPARCLNCDNKDRINSLLEKLLKEKEREINEIKQINLG